MVTRKVLSLWDSLYISIHFISFAFILVVSAYNITCTHSDNKTEAENGLPQLAIKATITNVAT